MMRTIKTLARNTMLSLVLNLTLRAAGTLTFIGIARLGSVADAGAFGLALGYLALLTTLFSALDDILVRETARDPDQVLPLLATYGTIRLVVTGFAWLGLVFVLHLFSVYSAGDLMALVIITSSILFDALTAMTQSVLNAKGQFGWPVAATLVGSLVRIAYALFALLAHYGLVALSLAWPIGSLVIAGIIAVATWGKTFREGRPRPLRFERDTARALLRLSPGFSFAGILAGFEYQADIILLSFLIGNEAVAQYSAAVTIMMMVQMVSQAYRIVLFPAIVRAIQDGQAASRQLVERSLIMMASLSIVLAGIISFLGPQLVTLLYGARFTFVAGSLVQILIWNMIFLFLNVPLVRYLMASGGQTTVWQTLLISLSINVIGNLVLIPVAGVSAAAFIRLISSGVFCALTGWHVWARLSQPKLILTRNGLE